MVHTSDVPLALLASKEERQHIARLRRHSLLSGGRRGVVRIHALTQQVLVFKAHRLVYHSTLGWRVIKKKKRSSRCCRSSLCEAILVSL